MNTDVLVPRVGFMGGFFGLLLTATVLAAAAGMFRGGESPAPAMERVVWLTFQPIDDGRLTIRELEASAPLEIFDPADDSFAQGVYKSVARERSKRGINAQEPVQLGRTSDGQLFLFDPLTSTRIALRAFGETNAAVFETLLERVLIEDWENANG